jgi:hypothetical protein
LGRGRSRTVHVVLVALLGVSPPAALPGASDPPPTGPRVRVTLASSGTRIVGDLVEQNESALFIQKGRKDPKCITIPRSDVAQLERSVQPSRKGRGLGIGLLVGAAVAVGVGLASGNDCVADATGFDNLGNILCSQTEKAAMVGLLTVPLGMLLGAMAAPGEQWRPEGLPSVAVGVGPAPGGGVSAQVALRF